MRSKLADFGTESRPRLTASILSRNGASRLPRLLAEIGAFADEIVVGVDASSTDATLEVALGAADTVFLFNHRNELSAARTRIFDLATGDWIFVIDDDECLEPGFPDVLRELMMSPFATHAWFPRKWVVENNPSAFLFSPPWYPDWQMRLFRNDPALVWKPARPHSGYHVMGPGLHECRAGILHFEPLWLSPEERQAKLKRYKAGGARGPWEQQYKVSDQAMRRPCCGLTQPRPDMPRRGPGRLAEATRDAPSEPLWGVEIVHVEMGSLMQADSDAVAEVRVRNTGQLAWWPAWGARSALLAFSHHLLTSQGEMLLWDCERSWVQAPVRPGEEMTILHQFRVPHRSGDYLLEWDMVSEGETWFHKAEPRRLAYSPLRVRS